jgi:hypothetical protein
LAQLAQQAFGPAGLAPRGSAHDGQELVVDEQLAALHPLAPQGVEMAGERRPFDFREGGGYGPADDVPVKHEPCIERASQQHLAYAVRVIQLVHVGGLERHARNMDRAHQRPVAQLHRHGIVQPPIGQPIAGSLFPLAPAGGSGGDAGLAHGA